MSEDPLVAELRAAGCVFAEDEAALLRAATSDPAVLAGMAHRRTTGEPLEYVLGWAALAEVRVPIVPGVFIPRRRTAALVDEALVGLPADACVLDLCCGAGAIALAVAARRPDVVLHAADVGATAVECARRTLAEHGGRVYLGDLFAAVPDELTGSFDLITANVPYVPSAAIDLLPVEAREYEPRVTLDGGVDGLDVLRRVVADSPPWLRPGGRVLFEIGGEQVEPALGAARRAGLVAHTVHSDGWDTTVLVATRQSS